MGFVRYITLMDADSKRERASGWVDTTKVRGQGWLF